MCAPMDKMSPEDCLIEGTAVWARLTWILPGQRGAESCSQGSAPHGERRGCDLASSLRRYRYLGTRRPQNFPHSGANSADICHQVLKMSQHLPLSQLCRDGFMTLILYDLLVYDGKKIIRRKENFCSYRKY